MIKIEKNRGQVKELTEKYILVGATRFGRNIYAKVRLSNVMTYILMKIGIFTFNGKRI